MTDSQTRVVDKLRKLQAHMESASKIGNDTEAQAFAAMMQKLMDKHNLATTDLEFEEERSEPIIERLVQNQKYGIPVKKTRIAWQEEMASVIAAAYNCCIAVIPKDSRISLVGRASDVAVAEFMFVTLVRYTESRAQKAYVKYFYECRDRGDVSLARGYKASFIEGFIVRLQQRLKEDRQETINQAESKETALVRINQKLQDVKDFMNDWKPVYGLTRHKHNSNRDGFHHGTEEANRVDLGKKAVSHGNITPNRTLKG